MELRAQGPEQVPERPLLQELEPRVLATRERAEVYDFEPLDVVEQQLELLLRQEL